MTERSPDPAAASPSDPPQATRREWVGLAVLALPCLLYSMDLTVLNLAIPHLSADLNPTSAQLLWIVDIYGFLVAGSLITMGTLGDRIGRRRILMIGATAFGIASVLAAFAPTAELLIAARAALGVAAATLAPSTLSLIRNMFHDPRQRTFAIGIWIASFSAGGALGPVIGGLLLTWFWWGSVFLIAVPVMVLLLILGPRLLPEYRDPDAGSIDIPSAVLSLAAVLAVIYGIKRIAETGLGWLPVVIILAGIGIGVAFVRRQRQLADPLIDLALFRNPAFSAALAINILGIFAAFGIFLYGAQYLQLVLGMDPFTAGLWTAPSGLAFIAGSILAPGLARRMPPAQIVAAGLGVAAIGFALLAGAIAFDSFVLLMTAFIVFALGLSPVFTFTTDLIVGAAPPERAGAASAISETAAEFGGALGIAVLGSIATAIYRDSVAAQMPAGLDTAAAEAAINTLAGALTVAAALPAAIGADLIRIARTAFSDGFLLAAGICTTITILAALLAAGMLHPRKPAATPAD
ncbi:MAG: MFS transporter [Ferrovibrio sp.]|uniref:MFS transporter n=1 Tax=Ferrovibrio sp. TaxID=1917215 RepID=UPI003918CA99